MQTNKEVNLHKKSSDPLNLPMTPKFFNNGSSVTPQNSGLAETVTLCVLCENHASESSRMHR